MLKIYTVAVTLALASTPLLAAPLALTTPCDLSQSSLGVGFQGHNADAVLKAVKALNTKKDEYETQAVYEVRQKTMLVGTPSAIAEGMLCYVEKDDSAKYDPETKTLWVTLFLDYPQTWFDGVDLHQEYQHYVSERNRKDSTYVGSNAYGATTSIHKMTRDATHITFDSKPTKEAALAAGAVSQSLKLQVPVSLEPERARSLKDKVQLAVQYAPAPPFQASNQDRDMPNMDMPFDFTEQQSLLVGRVIKVVAYSKDTGEVLATLNFSN